MPKTPSAGPYHFAGFVAPRYTPTPDQLFDELLAPGLLTEAELRVLLYIIRRTFGWKKDQDAISLSQITDGIIRRDGQRLDWGAGVAKSSAVRAVKGLVAKGVIIAERHQSVERGFEATTYALCLREPLSQGETRASEPLSQDETRSIIALSHDETRGAGPLSGVETRALPLSSGEARGGSATMQHETRASVRVEPALVAPRNIQETRDQESIQQDNDSKRLAHGKSATAAKYSPYIAGVVLDFSRELGDGDHGPANVTHALRLWAQSDLGEEAFVQQLYTARQRTRTAQGRQGQGRIANRMAYFFEVVHDLLGTGKSPADGRTGQRGG